MTYKVGLTTSKKLICFFVSCANNKENIMEDLENKIQEYFIDISELHYDFVVLGIPVEILIFKHNNCLEICEIGKSYDDKLRIKFKEEYKNIKEVCEKIKDIK